MKIKVRQKICPLCGKVAHVWPWRNGECFRCGNQYFWDELEEQDDPIFCWLRYEQ